MSDFLCVCVCERFCYYLLSPGTIRCLLVLVCSAIQYERRKVVSLGVVVVCWCCCVCWQHSHFFLSQFLSRPTFAPSSSPFSLSFRLRQRAANQTHNSILSLRPRPQGNHQLRTQLVPTKNTYSFLTTIQKRNGITISHTTSLKLETPNPNTHRISFRWCISN